MSGTGRLTGGTPAAVVCTLGMHRSGTSLVSRVLNLLGVHLGPPELVSRAAFDNPKGHWEHPQIVGLNDEILAQFGGTWAEPPEFPPSWPLDPRLEKVSEKARHLLSGDFAVEPLWGWKDPRTCLTLPFWQHLVGPMRYVICVRNPSAVTASLTLRDGMSPAQADRLWLMHAQASLAHTPDHPRLFVFYEDLIQDWPTQLRRMAAFVGDAARADDRRVRDAVAAFLERDLCHHRDSIEDLIGDDRISAPAKRLFVALRVAAFAEERDALGREQAATLRTLEEIHTSSAWKLVTFGRALIVAGLPAGTRRRKVFDAILRRVARRLPSPGAQGTSVDPRPA